MKFNRRNFLSTAATISAASTLDVHTSLAAEAKSTVNFALVGLGSLSTHQLAPALQKTKHAKLVGIVTGTPDKEKVWADKYGIKKKNIYNYENYDKLRDNEEIDVVYIVLPNGLHAEYTVRAAAAGKHVLCEKPMANTSDECRQMIDACKQNNRKLAIGYRCQFEPHHQRCIELAQTKKFGDLKVVEAGFGFKIGDPNQWRLKSKLAGGGAMMDVGVYALQACRYVTGEEPKSITAQETKTDPKKFAEVDETISWTMAMPSGVNCVCTTSYAFNGINRYRAFADNGWFGLEPAFSYDGIRGQTSEGAIEAPEIDQFAAEIDAFAKCILDDQDSTVPGEEGLRDLVAVEAIYESIRSGRRVDMEGEWIGESVERRSISRYWQNWGRIRRSGDLPRISDLATRSSCTPNSDWDCDGSGKLVSHAFHFHAGFLRSANVPRFAPFAPSGPWPPSTFSSSAVAVASML